MTALRPAGLVGLLMLVLVSPFGASGIDSGHGLHGGLHELPLALAVTTVAFQDGRFPTRSYAGTLDTTLVQTHADNNYGRTPGLFVDGDNEEAPGTDQSALLRWNVSQIPSGSQVQWVSLTLYITNTSTDTYSIYALERNWIEGQATWNNYSANRRWAAPGAQGAADRGDRMGTIVATRLGYYVTYLSTSGVTLVQDWINNPRSNNGLQIAGPENSNGLDFLSRETSTPSRRPKLTIAYLPPLSPPPTNETSGSPIRNPPSSRPSGVPRTVTTSSSSFAAGCQPLTLELGKTITDTRLHFFDVCANLSGFFRGQTATVTITRPDGSRYLTDQVSPGQNGFTAVDYDLRLGQPTGTYLLRLSQGRLWAELQFQLDVPAGPTLELLSDTGRPGDTFQLLVSSFPSNTPIHIYREKGSSGGGLSIDWEWVASLNAPSVNERGEAYYILHTDRRDPKDRYLIIGGSLRGGLGLNPTASFSLNGR